MRSRFGGRAGELRKAHPRRANLVASASTDGRRTRRLLERRRFGDDATGIGSVTRFATGAAAPIVSRVIRITRGASRLRPGRHLSGAPRRARSRYSPARFGGVGQERRRSRHLCRPWPSGSRRAELEGDGFGLLDCSFAPAYRLATSVALLEKLAHLWSTLRLCFGRFLETTASADAPHNLAPVR